MAYWRNEEMRSTYIPSHHADDELPRSGIDSKRAVNEKKKSSDRVSLQQQKIECKRTEQKEKTESCFHFLVFRGQQFRMSQNRNTRFSKKPHATSFTW